MHFSKTLMAGAAALALFGCGDKSASDAPKSEAAAQASKVSAGSPLDEKFTLKGGEAVDIEKFIALLPEKSRPTYESAEFDKTLGASVVKGLRFADDDNGEAVIVDRAEFYGVDNEAIDRIRNAENSGPDAPFATVFEKIRLLSIHGEGYTDEESGEELAFKIAGVEFDKLAIREGGLKENEETGADPNFFNAVSLAGLYFKDLDFATVGEASEKIDAKIPDMRVVGMAGGKIDAVIIKDLDMVVEQSAEAIAEAGRALGPAGAALYSGPLANFLAPASQEVAIGLFEWRDIDFSGAVKRSPQEGEPPATERDLMDFGSIVMKDLTSSIEGRKASSVEEVSVSRMKFAWLIPSDFRMDIKNGVADYTAYFADKSDPAYAVMKENGLDNVKGDGFAEWNWNPDTGNGELAYDMESKNFADMSLGFEMAGATLDDIAAAQAEGNDNAFAENAKFKSFNLKLEDENALDAIFALAALQMGGTGEDLRQSAPALIRLSSAQFAQINPRIKDYAEAFAGFVADGGKLTIDAEPKDPLGAETLSSGAVNAQNAPDILNLTVVHEK